MASRRSSSEPRSEPDHRLQRVQGFSRQELPVHRRADHGPVQALRGHPPQDARAGAKAGNQLLPVLGATAGPAETAGKAEWRRSIVTFINLTYSLAQVIKKLGTGVNLV